VALSAFDDKSGPPTESELDGTLGRSSRLWRELTASVTAAYAPVESEWAFSGEKYGWTARLKRKSRVILYMIPGKRHFLVGFVLGRRAVEAARQADLPPSVGVAIDSAPKYAEGTGVRLEVRTKNDLDAMLTLAAIKMAN
jgi:hypothetical protein